MITRIATELVYHPDVKVPFEIYVDSNWESSKSVSGALFFLHGCAFGFAMDAAAIIC